MPLMRIHHPHPWDLSPGEARALQARLRPLVEKADRFAPPRTVAGVDVGFHPHRRLTRAAVACLWFPSLEPAAEAVATVATTFPYVPGLLSFREIPAILEALRKLERAPDVILCDAHGYAHPRRFGLACHLGVLLDWPMIGVAKTRLIGSYCEPPRERGAWVPLRQDDEIIGAVVRTRTNVKPIFVSIGHRINLPSAVELVLRCTPRYRLPETTRRAHRLASTLPW